MNLKNKIISKQDFNFLFFIVYICLSIITWKYTGSKDFYHIYIEQHLSQLTFMSDWLYHFFATTLFFLISPLLYLKIFNIKLPYNVFKTKFSKNEIGIFLALCLIFVFLSYGASKDESFQHEYPFNQQIGLTHFSFLKYSVMYLLFYYLPWEFFYRSFIQGSLLKHMPLVYAIAFQVLASTLAHIGKPSGEIYGAIFGAIIWGYWAHKNKSILLTIMTHWILGASLDYFIWRSNF